ncbi:unnamed protein product, partial [Brachionus calyciflorus]
MLLDILVNESFALHNVDISTAFLYGEIEEEIYIEPPDGMEENLGANQVL